MTTTTDPWYQDRLRLGHHHEAVVRERLTGDGWTVQEWGQGILDDDIRKALRAQHVTVWWRWLPDIVAIRGSRVLLVDPKNSQQLTSPTFNLEEGAWCAHQLMRPLGLPIVYVWADFTCQVAWRVDPVCHMPGAGEGRTPYVKVARSQQLPWADVFGRAAA